MDIQLNFSNLAGPRDATAVVLYQLDAAEPDAPVTAWKVIRQCGHGWTHPFVYGAGIELALNDEYGNYSPHTPCAAGQAFSIACDTAGHTLACTGADPAGRDVTVRNAMTRGAMHVCVFRQRRLLARRASVAPGQTVRFRFDPVLWIATAPGVVDGALLDPGRLGSDRTALPLRGVASADIVLRGGGAGPGATALQFHFENIARA